MSVHCPCNSRLCDQAGNQEHPKWRKINCLFFFPIDDVIIYVGNSMEPTNKMLELKSEFFEIAGYKTMCRKSTVLLYASHEQLEIEIKISVYNSIKI